MSNDVLITPGSRKIEFKDSSGNVDAVIQTDSSGNLSITNTGGDLSLGDTSSDVFIGDGTNNIDLVFEQNGEIRGTSGVTVTVGASGSTVNLAGTVQLGGTTISSTGAELNILDGVTATAAEINKLDGVTATTAELNILDGVTATATELNLMDGVTATTAELNHVDGVTSAIQTQLDTKPTKHSSGGIDTLAVSGTNARCFKINADLGTNENRPFEIKTPASDDANAPYQINTNNTLAFQTDGTNRLTVIDAGISVTGAITVSGTVDGRDLATDGTKLDGVASSATANPNAIDNVVEDTTPQLGGDLDLNSSDITGTGNINITGTVTADGLTVGTAQTVGSVSADVNISGANATDSYINLTRTSSDANSGVLNFGKTSSGSVVSNSDFLGAIQFCGDDGTDINTAGARIRSQVTGTVASNTIPASIIIQTAETSSGPLDRLKVANTGDISFYNDAGSSQDLYWDASTSRLGLGTTSPSFKLDVSSGTDDFGARFLSSDSTSYVSFQDNSTANSISVFCGASGDHFVANGKTALRLLVDLSEAARIDSSGNVGIGTTSPDGLLHVSSGTSGDATVIIEADTDNNEEGDIPQLWFKADGDRTEAALRLNNNELQIISNVSTSSGIEFLTGTTNNTGTTDPGNGATKRMGIDASGIDVTGNIAVSGTVDGRDVATDGTKLDGIATGAEVNQNAFSSVAVSGQTTVEADGKTDTLTLAAGSNVTITTNATSDTVTIASTAAASLSDLSITATATELNKLDGATVTTAEINILDGVTSTTAELNILDGVTSTTAELNILDGVTATATELNLMDGVTATTTELNYVDGVTSAIQTQLDGKLSTSGGTLTGNLIFEGATADAHETTVTVTDPTADRTITLPDATGTVILNSNLNFPFFQADGSSDTIALTADLKVPFTESDGSTNNISLTT
jgi:hypothetical protein|tara:strand:- start:1073 stop:3844 length:2772 start_codon:yes stop_codon:yes gene_type:complete